VCVFCGCVLEFRTTQTLEQHGCMKVPLCICVLYRLGALQYGISDL